MTRYPGKCQGRLRRVEGYYESASVVGIVLVLLTTSVAVIARLMGSRYELS